MQHAPTPLKAHVIAETGLYTACLSPGRFLTAHHKPTGKDGAMPTDHPQFSTYAGWLADALRMGQSAEINALCRAIVN